MVQAENPTTISSSFVNATASTSRQGVAFAVVFSKATGTVDVKQDGGSDGQFNITIDKNGDPQGTSETTGKDGGSENTSSPQFITGTDTTVNYTVDKPAGSTPIEAYDINWVCTIDGKEAPAGTVTTSGTTASVKVTGNQVPDCTATVVAKGPKTGPGTVKSNPTDQALDLGDLGTTPGNGTVNKAVFDNGQTTKETDKGTWNIELVDGKAKATFTPKDATVTGQIPVEPYTITDTNGLTAKSDLNVFINLPPTTGDDTKTINPDQTATLTPETTKGTGDITDVKFDSPNATDDGKTLVVPGEGKWTIQVVDGKVTSTFKPETGYHGSVTDQPYSVTDSNKLTSNQGTLKVNINVPPTTGDDTKTINPDQTATLTPETTKGTGDITDVKFDSPNATDDGKTLVVPGEGKWTIQVVDGKVTSTFKPETGYHGSVTDQPYSVTDSNKLTSNQGTLKVNINVPPQANPDHQTIKPGETATLNPETIPGTGELTQVTFDNGETTKHVPGEGTWKIELVDGRVVSTFTPDDPTYTGKVTPQAYTVTDVNGLTATSTLSVDIVTDPVTPTPSDEQPVAPNSPDDSKLAHTGLEIGAWAAGALALVAAGLAGIIAARRKHS
nr:hypothetical protein [Pseudoclavibacter sp. 13-3]